MAFTTMLLMLDSIFMLFVIILLFGVQIYAK